MEMPLHVDYADMLLRLVLAAIAGGVLGFDREQRGHAAGFRTTILVALAAAIAMVQANVLLPVDGKTAGSFGVIDVGRFPLGILTGVGFIGGGTILKRGDLVTGVTTAATLWIVTAIGLCFGGGQFVLGAAGAVLGVVTLGVLRHVDDRIPRDRRVEVTVLGAGAAGRAILDMPATAHCRINLTEKRSEAGEAVTVFSLTWQASESDPSSAKLLAALDANPHVVAFQLESGLRR